MTKGHTYKMINNLWGGIKMVTISGKSRLRELATLTFYGALVLGGVGLCTSGGHLSRDTYQVKVTDAITKRNGDSDKYLVFTKNLANGEERVFENVDSIIEGKWDSSNLQARLADAKQHDKTCDISAYGVRIPFFSWYENIVDVNCK